MCKHPTKYLVDTGEYRREICNCPNGAMMINKPLVVCRLCGRKLTFNDIKREAENGSV